MRITLFVAAAALATLAAQPDAARAQQTTVIAESGKISVPSGYTPIKPGDASFAELAGAEVFNIDGVKVAEITGVQGTHDGAVTEVIADVGSFLGLPARNVLLAPDQIIIVTNSEAAFRAYVGATHAVLMALPEYAVVPAN